MFLARTMFVCLLVLSLAAICSSQYICPQGWDEFRQRCYKFTFYPPESNYKAALKCQSDGAALLSVEDRSEHDFIVSWLSNRDQKRQEWYTSGFLNPNVDDQFLWESTAQRVKDPDPNSQTPLYWHHPSDRFLEGDYIIYSYEGTYGWKRSDGEKLRAYICETPMSESYRINQHHRDFTYGIAVYDPNIVPRGPKLIVNPVDTIILGETTSVYLECVAVGYPQAEYTWMRNSSQELITSNTDERYTLTNGRLTIQEPQDSLDSGDYQCTAANQFGELLSPPVQLSFATMGEFSNVDTAQVNPKEYEGAAIECPDIPSKNQQAIRYHWMKNRKEFIRPELNDFIFISKSGKLYFSEVTRADEGSYYCLATLTSPQGNDNYVGASQTPSRLSRAVDLVVIGQPGSLYNPRIQDSFVSVYPGQPLVGDTITLECFAYGTGPLVYSWLMEEKELPKDPRFSLSDFDRVLTIEDLRLEDTTTFRCTVSSRRTYNSHTKLYSLRVEAKPYFSLPLRDQHVDVGNELTWRCVARGIPTPIYTWYKNGVLLENSTDNHLVVSGNLIIIRNLEEERDSGIYQCSANNSRGVSFSTAQLRVLSIQPSFTKNPLPPRITATIGGNVTIPCQPEAAPIRTLSWLKDGGDLNVREEDVTSRIRKLPGGSDLFLSELSMGDAGTYTCRVENELGAADSSTTLTILSRTQIYRSPSNTQVDVNATATFQCAASVNPQLDLIYIWTLNGHTIDVDNSPNYARGSRESPGLYIRFAQYKNEGNYTCIAMTQIDSDARSAILTVIGPPGEPAGVYTDQSVEGPRSIVLKWTDGPIHGSPITYYIVEGMTNYTNKWKTIKSGIQYEDTVTAGDPTKRTTILRNLKPGTGYQLRVRAINRNGIGEQSLPSEMISIPGAKPERPPEEVGGGGGKVGALRITWKALAEEDHNGYGIQYLVSFRKKAISESKWENANVTYNGNEYVTTVGPTNYYSIYEVRVTPHNIYGFGPPSDIVEIYSAEDLPVGTPQNVYSEPLNSTAQTVFWDPVPDSRETMKGKLLGYKLNYWVMDEEEEIQAIQAIYQGQTDHAVIIGLEANSWYTVNVQVYNTAGNGPKSEDFHQETYRKPPQLYPTEVYVYSHGPDSVLVKFRGVSTQVMEEPLMGYMIRYYRSTQNIREAENLDVDKANEGVIYGIKKGVIYKLRVLGYSRGGDGKLSSPATLFTLAGGSVMVDPATSVILAGTSMVGYSVSVLIVSLMCAFWML